MSMRAFVAHTAGLALVLACAPATASTLDLFGFGARSSGLAGAGAATSNDYESVYVNPAGLAEVRQKRATVGGLIADFDLNLDGNDAGIDSATGLVLGGALPIPLGGWAKDRLGLGFGFYVPGAAINRASQPFPGEPTYVLLANRSHVVALQVAVGMRLSRHVSVGAGVLALAVLRGSIAVTADPTGHFSSESEQRLLTRFAPVIGARYRRGTYAAGMVVHAPSRSDYDLQVTTDLADALPLALPPIRISGTAQYDPLTVVVEGAAFRGNTTFMAQLAYQRWSAFPLPTNNAVSGTPPQQSPDFHDTVIPRLAVEHRITRGDDAATLRAGYALLLSPAGEQRGQQSLLDNHRHLLALGGGVELGGALPLRLDVFAQLQVLQPRRHDKDPALQVGDNSVPFDSISTGGRVLVLGVAVGVDL